MVDHNFKGRSLFVLLWVVGCVIILYYNIFGCVIIAFFLFETENLEREVVERLMLIK